MVWQCMSNESVVGVCDRLLPLCHTVAKEVANRVSLFHMAMWLNKEVCSSFDTCVIATILPSRAELCEAEGQVFLGESCENC